MQRFLLSSVALLALTAAAGAADLARRAPPPPVVAPIPLFTWSGFYAGVNLGGAWENNDSNRFLGFGTDLAVPTPPVGALTPIDLGTAGFAGFGDRRNRGAFIGGGQIGYNFQFTPGTGFVVGVEADVQGVATENDRRFFGGFGAGPEGNVFTATPTAFATGLGVAPVVAGAPGNVVLFNNAFGDGFFGRRRHDVFGTVRGRIGYAWDRWLVYGTGGLAWTDNNNDNNEGFLASGTTIPTPFFISAAAAATGATVVPGTAFFGNRNNDNIGWTAGGGVEYAFTNNFTARIEGLFVSFNNNDRNRGVFATGPVGVTNTGAPVTRIGTVVDDRRRNDEFWVVRAAVNYKFSTY